MALKQQIQTKGPNLQALGFKSPMDVIDLLALLKIDGEPIIKDDHALLDPKLKTQTVLEYFQKNFKVSPNELPYLASLIKKDLKYKKIIGGKN